MSVKFEVEITKKNATTFALIAAVAFILPLVSSATTASQGHPVGEIDLSSGAQTDLDMGEHKIHFQDPGGSEWGIDADYSDTFEREFDSLKIMKNGTPWMEFLQEDPDYTTPKILLDKRTQINAPLTVADSTTVSTLTTTGGLNAGDNEIDNVADPSQDSDAATKGYVDDSDADVIESGTLVFGSANDGDTKSTGSFDAPNPFFVSYTAECTDIDNGGGLVSFSYYETAVDDSLPSVDGDVEVVFEITYSSDCSEAEVDYEFYEM